MAISFREAANQSFQDFWAKKIRSLVTILGIVLGTASIIIVMSIVQGTTAETMRWMEETGGFTKIEVSRNWEYDKPTKRKKSLEHKEVQDILRNITGIKYKNISSNIPTNKTTYKKNTYYHWVSSVSEDYFLSEEWGVQEGRLFTPYDYKHKEKVVVIGTTTRRDLFGSINPIGKKVTIRNEKYTVVGLLDKREYMGKGEFGESNWLEWKNGLIIVPLTTAFAMYPENDRIRNFSIITTDEKMTETVQNKLKRSINGIFEGKPVYRVTSNLENRETMLKQSSKFNIIFYFISAISLIVGGIVIMNIMLATVKERTREIGVRMAIGGSRFDIFLQFLIQTVIVTSLGGLVGVILGMSLVDVVGSYVNVTMLVNTRLILISLGMSSGVGLIFGIIPSWQACTLNPVKALRTE